MGSQFLQDPDESSLRVHRLAFAVDEDLWFRVVAASDGENRMRTLCVSLLLCIVTATVALGQETNITITIDGVTVDTGKPGPITLRLQALYSAHR